MYWGYDIVAITVIFLPGRNRKVQASFSESRTLLLWMNLDDSLFFLVLTINHAWFSAQCLEGQWEADRLPATVKLWLGRSSSYSRDLVIFVYNLVNCLAFSLQMEFVLKVPCLLQMVKKKPLSLSIFVKLEIIINIGWKTKYPHTCSLE